MSMAYKNIFIVYSEFSRNLYFECRFHLDGESYDPFQKKLLGMTISEDLLFQLEKMGSFTGYELHYKTQWLDMYNIPEGGQEEYRTDIVRQVPSGRPQPPPQSQTRVLQARGLGEIHLCGFQKRWQPDNYPFKIVTSPTMFQTQSLPTRLRTCQFSLTTGRPLLQQRIIETPELHHPRLHLPRCPASPLSSLCSGPLCLS